MRYRIVEVASGEYIVQKKGLWWMNQFIGEWSDEPIKFTSVTAAELAITEQEERTRTYPRVVKEYYHHDV